MGRFWRSEGGTLDGGALWFGGPPTRRRASRSLCRWTGPRAPSWPGAREALSSREQPPSFASGPRSLTGFRGGENPSPGRFGSLWLEDTRVLWPQLEGAPSVRTQRSPPRAGNAASTGLGAGRGWISQHRDRRADPPAIGAGSRAPQLKVLEGGRTRGKREGPASPARALLAACLLVSRRVGPGRGEEPHAATVPRSQSSGGTDPCLSAALWCVRACACMCV